MERDIIYFTSQKLQGDWSAADFGKHVTPENLRLLIPKYERLEPLVRVRLLLSFLTLDKQKLASIQPELRALLALAKDDKEEWVSITARALNNVEPPLNLQAVISGSVVVERTIKDMDAQLDQGISTGFPPLEDLYLSPSLHDEDESQAHTMENHHFRIRNAGANSLEELYKKANESAAAAVNSIKAHPIANNSIRSTSISNPHKNTDSLVGFRARPSSSAMPLARQRPASSHSGIGRPGAESDMFRPSRPPDLGARPANTSMTGNYERKIQGKPGGVKLLDVNEVKRLNRNHVASPMRSVPSPQHSESVMNGRTRHKKVEEESEEEEGEIEAGEYTEDAQSGPSLKRARQTEVIS